MPYKLKGKSVYVKRNGWKKKGTSKTKAKAVSYFRTLQGIEHGHGWKPTGKKAKKVKSWGSYLK